AADDVFQLEASQLRSLMAQKTPSEPALEAVRALYLLLVDGRPSHPLLAGYSGIWGSDRIVLDPCILLPLLLSRSPEDASEERVAKLRQHLCHLHESAA
ncbi:unnamed protein product, partial [Polarella glacialis]